MSSLSMSEEYSSGGVNDCENGDGDERKREDGSI